MHYQEILIFNNKISYIQTILIAMIVIPYGNFGS